jgi:hypothetical protein
LDYAKDNRLEWELKERDIVREAATVLAARHGKVAPLANAAA